MQNQPSISAQASLPEIHRQYLDYRLSINKKAEESIIRQNKDNFYASLESYSKFFEFNQNKRTLFSYCVLYRDEEAIAHILNKVKRLDLSADVALDILECVVATDDIKLMKLLVNHGLNIDQPDDVMCTQLMYAASKCDIEFCSKLLACDAEITFESNLLMENDKTKMNALAFAFASTPEKNTNIKLEEFENAKIELLNFLLLWYWSKNYEPNLTGIAISEKIAKNIYLFGASKDTEDLPSAVHPQFPNAYKKIKIFLAAMQDKISENASNKESINFEPLYIAVMRCLTIAPNNSRLKQLKHDLDKFKDQLSNAPISKPKCT